MKKILCRCSAILLGTFALVGVSIAQPQLSGSPNELRGFLFPNPNTVSINGEADLTAYKDLAKVSLLVTTQERSLNEAMIVNQALRSDMIEQFLGAGISDTAINNSRFSTSPQFGLFGRTPNRFEVTARLEVTVGSEENLQLLAAAADAKEEVEFENTEFKHSQEDEFEDQVRELALADVMEQKAFYEANLGIELRAINFYYGGIRQMSRAMPMAARAQADSQELALSTAASSGVASGAMAVAPSFDEVEYQTSLNVVFEIVSDTE